MVWLERNRQLSWRSRMGSGGFCRPGRDDRTGAVLPEIRTGPMLRGLREVRCALARKENRGSGAAAKQTWPADSRLGATAAFGIEAHRLGARDAECRDKNVRGGMGGSEIG